MARTHEETNRCDCKHSHCNCNKTANCNDNIINNIINNIKFLKCSNIVCFKRDHLSQKNIQLIQSFKR